MFATLNSRWTWLCASLLLAGCSTPVTLHEVVAPRIERELLSQNVHIDVGDNLVMSQPHRSLRVTEQFLYRVTELGPKGEQLNQRDEYQTLPWSNRPVQVIAGTFATELQTDLDGLVRLNLLNDGFIELDYDSLRAIQLVVTPSPGVRSEVNLLIPRELRGKLHEAVALIYDNLEEDDVDQWAYRVQRLAELNLEEESNQLENMLILLTTGDPQLQGEFIHALEINQRP